MSLLYGDVSVMWDVSLFYEHDEGKTLVWRCNKTPMDTPYNFLIAFWNLKVLLGCSFWFTGCRGTPWDKMLV